MIVDKAGLDLTADLRPFFSLNLRGGALPYVEELESSSR